MSKDFIVPENYPRKYPNLVLGKESIYGTIKKLIDRVKCLEKLIDYNLGANFPVKVIVAVN